jgi:hypothetical protein
MDGQSLYKLYQRISASYDIGIRSWEKLDELKKNIWNEMATAINRREYW